MRPKEPATPSDRVLWAALLAGAVLGLAMCWAIAARTLPLGSPEARWMYFYVGSFEYRLLIAPALASVAAAALLGAGTPRTVRGDWIALFLWIVFATGTHAMMRASTPYTLESLFVSDAANSFYGVSRQHEPSYVLRRFNRVRQQSPVHVQSNMPGKLLFVYALRTITERTGVLPWLVVIASNLGAAVMYLFVRDLLDDRAAALGSAVLYLFVPARLFFFPVMNTVTPVLLLACAWLLMRWLRTGLAVWAALLGAALYALLIFDPLPLSMGLAGLGLAASAIVRGTISRDRIWLQSAVAVLALVASAIAMDLWTGFDVVRAFRQTAAHALEFNAGQERPYWFWVRGNVLEFLTGVGVCQAVLLAAALWHGLRGASSWRDWLARPIVVLSVGLLAVLLVLDLLGVNRGEVIRLWIFLACLCQIPAAYVCARLGSRTSLGIVVACSVFAAALGTAMIGFVLP